MNQGTKIVAVVLFVLFVGTGVYYVTLSPAKPATPSAVKPSDSAATRNPGSITMSSPSSPTTAPTSSATTPSSTPATGTAPRIADPLAAGATSSPASGSLPSASSTASGAPGSPGLSEPVSAPATGTSPRVTLGPGGVPSSVMPPLTVARPNPPASTVATGGTPSVVTPVRPSNPPASLSTAGGLSGNPTTTAAATAAREHVVANGDTLSSIAARYLGSEARWEEIAKANPGVNPNSMRVGTKLRIPEGGSSTSTASAASPSSAPAANEYVVKPGDTLTGIARQTLGNADWEAIYEANRAAIGPNPAALKVGMRLSIPKRS